MIHACRFPSCFRLVVGWHRLGLPGAGRGQHGLAQFVAGVGDAAAWQIVWDVRLPRTLGAWLAGALLGLAGAVAQGLFRNALADPFLLGSASGATLAVALALAVMGLPLAAAGWLARLGLTGAAFAGALGGVLLALALAQGAQHTPRLLLAGVVAGYALGACKDVVTLAAPDILQAMQLFMLKKKVLSLCCVFGEKLYLCHPIII